MLFGFGPHDLSSHSAWGLIFAHHYCLTRSGFVVFDHRPRNDSSRCRALKVKLLPGDLRAAQFCVFTRSLAWEMSSSQPSHQSFAQQVTALSQRGAPPMGGSVSPPPANGTRASCPNEASAVRPGEASVWGGRALGG